VGSRGEGGVHGHQVVIAPYQLQRGAREIGIELISIFT